MPEHLDKEYFTPVEAPLVVAAAEDIQWDDCADVVVIGFGGAGVVAAIAAREQGADVLAIDRFAGGGATAYSGGVIYAGATRFQSEAGYQDSAENMYQYLSQEASAVQPQTLRRYCDESAEMLEWLVRHGVNYSSEVYEGKTTYPPEGHFLYYSGNEKSPVYRAISTPSPRGHRAVGEGFTGYAYYSALSQSANSLGVRLMQHAPARRLIVDGEGVVIGLEVVEIPEYVWPQHDQLYRKVAPMKAMNGKRAERAIADCRVFEDGFTGRRRIRAKGGVIIAAGGYVCNLDMVRRYRPRYAEAFNSVMRLGSMGCDGSGIELGRSAGADTDLLQNFFVARSIAPPSATLGGIIVNHQGQRFINEDVYTGFLGRAIGDQPHAKAWLVQDRKTFWETVKQCLFPGKGLYLYTLPTLLNILFGGTKSARTLEALAQKCQMDPRQLAQSVEAYNQGAARGQDPLGKAPEYARAFTQGRYYAVNMDLGNKFTITMMLSLGGLLVDEENGAVMRPDGTCIRGLYAAGRSAVGLNSAENLSGMSIGDTVFSGRRSGRAAALAALTTRD